MDRNILFGNVASRIHLIYRLILFSLFSVTIVFAVPKKTITDVEAYFSDLDSALSTIGQEMSRYGAKRAKEPLEKMLQDYPGIEFLLWVNSKGVVVNEAVREGKPGKPHRNLSRQKWYEEITSLKPYYSSLKTRKGDHQLFWCKPIRITKSGRERSGGAIVARIDLKRSFNTVAKKIGTPFRVLQERQPFFSHSWEMSYDSTALPLAIKGLSDVQISVHEKEQALPPESEKKERGFPFTIVIVLLSVGIVSFVVWSIAKVVVKMSQAALIRRIEGDEPFVEPAKSIDEPGEDDLIDDELKAAEAILSKKREEDSLSETEVKMPPNEKSEVILEPEESTTEETVEAEQPEEVPDTAEKEEVTPEIPPTRQEVSTMDFVPEETVAIIPDFTDAIKAIKPWVGEEANEITVAAEEEPKTIPPDIMEKVEALLKKHLDAVLAERVKQIEEDVLARVRDELAGRMNDNEQ